MAKVKVELPDQLTHKIFKLGEKTDEIVEKVLMSGAEVVEPKVRANLQAVIGKDVKMPSRSTGELLASLGTSPVNPDKWGYPTVKVGFSEPRRKQSGSKGKSSYYVSTNAMIANVLEYGKSGQPPKPFLKPAKSASRKACTEAMIKKFEEEIKKL